MTIRRKSVARGAEVTPRDSIAVIGASCRVPGAEDTASFWSNLCNGVESVHRFTAQEVLSAGEDPATAEDEHYVPAGAVLTSAEAFDEKFFGYSPAEAALMDPQQRIFLQLCWSAIEDAGYTPDSLDGSVGVYAGASPSTYLLRNLASHPELLGTDQGLLVLTGNDKDYISSRVSYKLDLRGPSLCVGTACSSSLAAVHLACENLWDGTTDVALAGGVSVRIPQTIGYLHRDGSILSRDGHCRAFDREASGTVFGSGAGVVVLKRLKDALEAGDRIEAIVLGSCMNNDGAQKLGYTAPGFRGQVATISKALAKANVRPEEIGFIEAHGTGTTAGDAVEVAALREVFRSNSEEAARCALGSVKTNIGHLDAAAGIVGFIKTVLVLKSGLVPPTLHFREPNPDLELNRSPFYVNDRLLRWPPDREPRRAGVSAFGIGGTNVHVVLGAPPLRPMKRSSRRYHLVPISALNRETLSRVSNELESFLRSNPRLDLADFAYTLQVGRKALSSRRAVICGSIDDLMNSRDSTVRGLSGASTVDSALPPSVALVLPRLEVANIPFDGTLYQSEPIFRACIDKCTAIARPLVGSDIIRVLFDAERPREPLVCRTASVRETWVALFAWQYALGTLLMHYGLTPTAYFGEGPGEFAVGCLVGLLSVNEGISLAIAHAEFPPIETDDAEEAREEAPRQCVSRIGGHVRVPIDAVGLTAPSLPALAAKLRSMVSALRKEGPAAFESVRLPLRVETSDRLRLAFVARDYRDAMRLAELALRTMGAEDGDVSTLETHGIYLRDTEKALGGKLAYLFPGQGSQYRDMGRELREKFPEIDETFERCDTLISGGLGRSLSSVVFSAGSCSDDGSALVESCFAQPAVLAFDTAMLRILRRYGVIAHVHAGHSLGEFCACVASGILSFEDAMRAVFERATAIEEVVSKGQDRGLLAAIRCDSSYLTSRFLSTDCGVTIANINSPTQTVVGGHSKDVRAVLKRLESAGFTAKVLRVSHAFHTPVIAPARSRFAQFLDTLPISAPGVPLLTCVDASYYTDDPDLTKRSLADQLVCPVDWLSVIERMYEDGVRTFVEVGPSAVLRDFVHAVLGSRPFHAYATNDAATGGDASLARALAALWADGLLPRDPSGTCSAAAEVPAGHAGIARSRQTDHYPPARSRPVPVISATTSRWVTASDLNASSYWSQRRKTEPSMALVASELLQIDLDIILMLGPSTALSTRIRQQRGSDRTPVVLSDLVDVGTNPWELSFLETLAKLWTHGVSIRWDLLYAGEERNRLALPTYPFERTRHWIPAGKDEEIPAVGIGAVHGDHAIRPKSRATDPKRERKNTVKPTRALISHFLTDVWREVLGLRSVRADGNFFSLGGDSLLAVQVVSRVCAAFGVSLVVKDIFDCPTVDTLTNVVLMRRPEDDASVLHPSRESRRTNQDPLSFAQLRLWFLERLHGPSPLYNMAGAFRLSGDLDLRALEDSVRVVLDRHETLRTVFSEVDGEPVACVRGSLPRLFVAVNWEDLSPTDRVEPLNTWLETEARKPFDLSRGPLFQALILCLRESERVLLVRMHHIVCDGWSIGLLQREVSILYNALRKGKAQELPHLEVQYTDYARWQRQWIRTEEYRRQLNYWRHQLSGLPTVGGLPLDRSRPKIQSHRGATVHFDMDEQLIRQLTELGVIHDATLFMILHAGFVALLAYHSGTDDIVVGTPVANRRSPGMECLVGFFTNMLVLRVNAGSDPTFTELLGRVRKTALEAYNNQDVPFERLVDEFRPARDPSHNPLFQTVLALQNTPPSKLQFEAVDVVTIEVDLGVSKFDLLLVFEEKDGGLSAKIEYAVDLFERSTIDGFVRKLLAAFRLFAERPEATLSSLKPVFHEPSELNDIKSVSFTFGDSPRKEASESRTASSRHETLQGETNESSS